MSRIVSLLISIFVMIAPLDAKAQLCTIDDAPGATLFFPYFEADLSDCSSMLGKNTLFSVRNAGAAPMIANVTVWTDWSIPVFNFLVYLTGYDVETLNMRTILCDGAIPDTGGISQPAFDVANLEHYQAWLKGEESPVTGNCAGNPRGNNLAIGYLTLDNVVSQNVSGNPSDGTSYFSQLSPINQMVGHARFREFATVREVSDRCFSCADKKKKKKRKKCQRKRCAASDVIQTIYYGGYRGVTLQAARDGEFTTDDRTFYGRYSSFSAADLREPLPGVYSIRNGFELGTGSQNLIVWRSGSSSADPVSCGNYPSWYPLTNTQLIAFDEASQAAEVIQSIPYELQEIEDWPSLLPYPAGWTYLNLHHNKEGSGNLAQAYLLQRINGVISDFGINSFSNGCSGNSTAEDE